MSDAVHLLGWVEQRGCDAFMGAFVGEGAAPDVSGAYGGRAPATQLCSSPDEARQWVREQAAAFDLPVKWVDGFPEGKDRTSPAG